MQRHHPKSKTEILDIAIPLFAEAGFNGVSMRAIAGEVGIKAAGLYHLIGIIDVKDYLRGRGLPVR